MKCFAAFLDKAQVGEACGESALSHQGLPIIDPQGEGKEARGGSQPQAVPLRPAIPVQVGVGGAVEGLFIVLPTQQTAVNDVAAAQAQAFLVRKRGGEQGGVVPLCGGLRVVCEQVSVQAVLARGVGGVDQIPVRLLEEERFPVVIGVVKGQGVDGAVIAQLLEEIALILAGVGLIDPRGAGASGPGGGNERAPGLLAGCQRSAVQHHAAVRGGLPGRVALLQLLQGTPVLL